jgi:hypothetical protein
MSDINETLKLGNIDSYAVEKITGRSDYYPIGDMEYKDELYNETLTEPDSTTTFTTLTYTKYTDVYDISDNGNWKNITDEDIVKYNSQMLNGGKYHANFAIPSHVLHLFDFLSKYVKRDINDNNKMIWTYYKKKSKNYSNILNPRPDRTIVPKYRSVEIGKKLIYSQPKCKTWSTELQNQYSGSKQIGNQNYCRNYDSDPNGDWCYSDEINKGLSKVYCYYNENKEISDLRLNAREAQYNKYNNIFDNINNCNIDLNNQTDILNLKKNELNTLKNNLITEETIYSDKYGLYEDKNIIKNTIDLEISNINDDISEENIIKNNLDESLLNNIKNKNNSKLINEQQYDFLNLKQNELIDIKEQYDKELSSEEFLTNRYNILKLENTELVNNNNNLSGIVIKTITPINDNSDQSVILNTSVEEFTNKYDNNCLNYKGCFKKTTETNYIIGQYLRIEIPYRNYRFKILKIEIYNNDNINIAYKSKTSQSSIVSINNPPLSVKCENILGDISSNSHCAVNDDDINGAEMHPYDTNSPGGPHWFEIDLSKQFYNILKSQIYPDKYYNINNIIIYYKNQDDSTINPINYTIKILDNNRKQLYQISENEGNTNIINNKYIIKHNIFYVNKNNIINNLNSFTKENIDFDTCKNLAEMNGYAYFSVSDYKNNIGQCKYWHQNWNNTIGKLDNIYEGKCDDKIIDKNNISRNIGNENEYGIYSINKEKCIEGFTNNTNTNIYKYLIIIILIIIIYLYIKCK